MLKFSQINESHPYGGGTADEPNFDQMHPDHLKKWMNRRLKNAAAHDLSPKRAGQYESAKAALAKHK